MSLPMLEAMQLSMSNGGGGDTVQALKAKTDITGAPLLDSTLVFE